VDEIDGVEMAKPGASEAAVITRILKTTAGAIFGEKTKPREGQSLEEAKLRRTYLLYFEGAKGSVGNYPMPVPDEGKVTRPKSSLGKFVARYGDKPRKGMTVSAHLAESGWLELDL
jgi:hypothetical protein